MHLKSTLIIFTLFASVSAFAQTEDYGTIFHYQAAANSWEVWPVFNIESNSLKPDGSTSTFTKYNQQITDEVVHVEYGITKNYSAGVELGMAQGSESASPSYNSVYSGLQNPNIGGMLDPNLFVKGRNFDVFGGSLHYGLSMTVSMGPQTISSTEQTNAAAGAPLASPFIGYEMPVLGNSGHWGVNFKYAGYLTDRSIKNSGLPGMNGAEVDQTRNGGQFTDLQVFYEQILSDKFMLGVAVLYDSYMATKTTTAGVMSNDANGNAGLGGAIYAAYFATSKIYIVPVFKYVGASDPTSYTNIQSATSMQGLLYVDFML